jgi:hypothetical protein
MNIPLRIASAALIGLLAGCSTPQPPVPNMPPVIKHFPVVNGFRGQPIPVIARVTDDTGKVKKVMLFYSMARQAQPLEMKMKKIGRDQYMALIPAEFFTYSMKVWYGIAAADSFGERADFPWQQVSIKDPDKERVQ